jgi:hypothetical protein
MRAIIGIIIIFCGGLLLAEESSPKRMVTADYLIFQAEERADQIFVKRLKKFLDSEIEMAAEEWESGLLMSSVAADQQDFSSPLPLRPFLSKKITIKKGKHSRGALLEMVALAHNGRFFLDDRLRIRFFVPLAPNEQ